jgi:hypothetical protein
MVERRMCDRPVRVVGAALLSIFALALAGCGGDDEASASSQQFADDVCSTLERWGTDVETTLESLSSAGLSVDRDDIEAAVDDVRGATDELADDLEALEAPETDAGSQARAELDELTTALSAQIDTVEQALESGGGVTAIAATVTAAVAAATSAVDSTYQDLRELEPEDELRDAFESSDDCESLRDRLESIRS